MNVQSWLKELFIRLQLTPVFDAQFDRWRTSPIKWKMNELFETVKQIAILMNDPETFALCLFTAKEWTFNVVTEVFWWIYSLDMKYVQLICLGERVKN